MGGVPFLLSVANLVGYKQSKLQYVVVLVMVIQQEKVCTAVYGSCTNNLPSVWLTRLTTGYKNRTHKGNFRYMYI